VERSKAQIESALEETIGYLRSRKEVAESLSSATAATPAKRTIQDILDEDMKLKASGERLAADDLHSPNTKDQLLAAVRQSRKSLAKETIALAKEQAKETLALAEQQNNNT
jgi:uncharacterized membrane protein YccC